MRKIHQQSTLTSEIAALVQVVEATELRKAEHEKRVTDSATNKKLADTEAFAEKKAAKADLNASLQKKGEDIEMEVAEARAVAKNTHNLHLKCDGMIKNLCSVQRCGWAR